jgi:hypothetical protein
VVLSALVVFRLLPEGFRNRELRALVAQLLDVAPDTISPPPPGTFFLHADHLGSPQLLTDREGLVVERLVHCPYARVGGVCHSALLLQSQQEGLLAA